MAREWKVYGSSSGWWRIIVASQTKKAAREALDVSIHEFANYYAETGNDIEVHVAMTQPGQPFIRPLDALGEDAFKWWKKDELHPWESRAPDVDERVKTR